MPHPAPGPMMPGMSASLILVGHDGSPHADDALALARLLAATWDADIVLGRVFPWEPLSAGLVSTPQLRADHDAQVQQNADLLQELADRERVGAQAIQDSSRARGLHALVEQLQPDLVVVGSSHRGAVGQVLAGNVALQLLNGLDRPLAVAPAGYAQSEHRLGTIGVGYDGSPESRAALAAASELAGSAGAEVEIIGACIPHSDLVATPWAFTWGAGATLEDFENRMRGRIETAGRQLPAQIPHSERLEIGPAASVLCEASEHVDLLVTGSRGYGPARRLLLGSVSSRVVREARCPVLAVPRPAAGEGEPVAAEATGVAPG
jgi:nucleotide-binding universal stress UspA family protein